MNVILYKLYFRKIYKLLFVINRCILGVKYQLFFSLKGISFLYIMTSIFYIFILSGYFITWHLFLQSFFICIYGMSIYLTRDFFYLLNFLYSVFLISISLWLLATTFCHQYLSYLFKDISYFLSFFYFWPINLDSYVIGILVFNLSFISTAVLEYYFMTSYCWKFNVDLGQRAKAWACALIGNFRSERLLTLRNMHLAF